MNAASFYRKVDPKLCRGDVFECVPHLLLKDQPRPLRPATLPGNKSGFLIEDLPEGTLPQPGKEFVVPAACVVARTMLLTYDCEIDKPKSLRTIALVRPLDPKMPQVDRDKVRNNQKLAFFYLPAQDGMLPECYVDFRRVSTISPEWVDRGKKLASLHETARQAMLMRFFLFLTRVRLDEAVFSTGPQAGDGAE
jgi:hypothetical protein